MREPISHLVPIELLKSLLLEKKSSDFHVMIIKTFLEFIQKLGKEKDDYKNTIEICCNAIRTGLKTDPLSFIIASKYFNRYLKGIASKNEFKTQILLTNLLIYKKNIEYWKTTTNIEEWISQNSEIVSLDHNIIIEKM